MTKFQTKIATAFATGAVLLNAIAPMAFASTTLTVTGNGSDSNSAINASATNTTSVVQNNSTAVTNTVDANANTGGNHANDNTGGNVDVTTGKAVTSVDITNTAGKNVAAVANCNCNDNTSVDVSGNGTHSDNSVSLDKSNTTELFQTNSTSFTNDVNAKATSGDNHANDNTGGDVSITTGPAATVVTLDNKAGLNQAVLGGAHAGGNGGISAKILGNGSYSDNSIDLSATNDVVLTQDNSTAISNDVYAKSNSGHNNANDNTGGNVDVTTGAAVTDVTVDNMAGFNQANIEDCGCLTDLEAKIGGNGTYSDNNITWAGDNVLAAFQTNETALSNDLTHLKSDSGDNKANDNTGSVLGNDPSLTTGAAGTYATVTNTGGSNTLGQAFSDLGHNVDFGFDFSSLWAMFWGHSSL